MTAVSSNSSTSCSISSISICTLSFVLNRLGAVDNEEDGVRPEQVGRLLLFLGQIQLNVIFTGMVLLHYKAMLLEEASRLVPLARLSAVLKLALLALFLDDRLQPAQYAAFGLMVLGALVLSRRPCTGGCFALPRGAGVIGAFVGLTAVYGFLDGHIILAHSPWVLQLWSNIGVILGTGLVLLMPDQRRTLQQALANTPNRFRFIILGEQTGRLLTGVLSDVAISVAGSAAIISVAKTNMINS